MNASYCATTSRMHCRLPGLLAGVALFACLGGNAWAQATNAAPVFSPSPERGVAASDPLTPPGIAPIVNEQQILWPVSDRAALSAGFRLDRSPAYTPADPGACATGILDAGCRSMLAPLSAMPADDRQGRVNLGARWQPVDGVMVGVDYFRDEGTSQPPGAMLLPKVLDFLAPGWYTALQHRGGSEGVDMSLAYGFDAGLIGELELNVQLSHVLDLTPPAANPGGFGQVSGLPDEPFTEASIGFNWTRGNFSGNLSSHYTEGLILDGRLHTTGMTTVDINFAWRTPWNASLSVGAQNLLGQEERVGNDFVNSPELDSAFSRVPYVRYEQDL